jgi:2-dehydropantoate 2-reductase
VRVIVFGGGAIGSLFSAFLVRSNHSVLLVARPATVAAIREYGLRVEGRTELTFPVDAEVALPTGTKASLVLLTVKSGDVREAALSIARAFPTPLPVVALQNGLGVGELLREGLREGGWKNSVEWIVRGLNSYGATLLGPGRVRHAGDGEVVLPAHTIRPEVGALVARVLTESDVQVRRVDDMARELWRKALVNAAVNPVTADHGVPNGALLHEPLRGQAERLLREAQAAASADGYAFTDEEADLELWRVVRATAENRSSMLQDLDRGRTTEVDAISGAILASGLAHGLDLPDTRRALDRIHRREAERRAADGPGPASSQAS